MDTILMVVEPSLDSLELAERAKYMSEGIGISRFRTIVNKSPSQELSLQLFDMLKERGLRRLGALPLSGEVSACSFQGVPLGKETDTYLRCIALLELLLDENEMDHPYCRI